MEILAYLNVLEFEEACNSETVELTWINLVLNYVQNGWLPSDKLKACKLQNITSRYTILDGWLYKSSYFGSLLKCVKPNKP